MRKKLIFILINVFLFNYNCNTIALNNNLSHHHSPKNAPYTKDSNNISNNGIYFIKNIGNNQIIDIPNSAYNVGTKPICYSAHYFANQRYVITYEFGSTYRIRPLNSQNLVFGINNNELILKEEEYNDTALFLDKFKFVKYGTTDYYYITDYYGNYLTLSNKTSSTGSSMIVESTINSSYLNYYLWSFVETDSLNVNCVQQDIISSNSYKYYNIRVPYSVSYRIETNADDVTILLYDNSTGNALCQNIVGQKYVEYIFNKNIDYSVRIYNNSTSTRTIQTKLSPKKTAFMYGVYDYNQHHHDRVGPLNSTKNYYESNNIFPIVYGNIGRSRLINSIENNSISNWVPFNSDYIVVRAHGTNGWFETYDGIQTNSLYYYSLPSMSDVEFASWIMCNSASNISGSYVTNIARESVVRGAQFSVGFKGEIFTDLGTTYSVGLGLAASHNYSPLYSAYYATEYTKSIYWTYYENRDTYPNNKIWEPYCYHRNSVNEIVYSIANVSNPVIHQDDGGYSPQNSVNINNKLESDTDANYAEINYFNSSIKLIRLGNLLTNILFDSNSYYEDLNVIDGIVKNYINNNENLILLKVGNSYKLIKIIVDPNSLESSYYDLIEEKYITTNQFITYSNNFVSLDDNYI